ncbi:glycosyltransferase family 2 protein [Rhodococcus sp. (in: high G+C Gram-positive bacteria)]|uniref:glycosyltransferase family 2 protein n=1 Tax=Rhodococcus sp. TaxID=1831 RepID=UPI001A0E4863|nr:galactosyltransferase-related protein [Rhodococcus sp. (in: high G+C Gram-positive bacteria)]MBF0661482.1 glycosyltransferase family 2 protein [Rhodococcus sp. (in: high G+C Gram-positive bacteria)]
MKVGVVTIAAHRTAHLRTQITALARGSRRPDQHVVVSMGDHEVFSLTRAAGADAQWMEPTEGRLPLAEARNLGARRALELGAELLVFLDVDCIPATNLVSRYEEVGNDPRHQVALLCGPVTYLPPPPVGGYDLDALDALISPHPARPHPRAGEVVTGEDYTLFWSLSFAVTAATWHRVGGFCTDYSGYGGEDTDFGQVAAQRGVGLRWVGGAHAFHQHHPVSDPPVERLDDILANANIFHDRWGWWPMRGWLDAFAERGLARYDKGCGRWLRGADRHSAPGR